MLSSRPTQPESASEDDQDSYQQGRIHRDEDGSSTGSWNENQDMQSDMLPESALVPESTPETPDEDGMLPRDIQQKTAYYDYAAEKSLSQADSKLFYQRSQLEAQKTGGSNWGASESSQYGSPILQPRMSNKFVPDSDGLRRSESVTSHKGNFQRCVPASSELVNSFVLTILDTKQPHQLAQLI